MEEERSPPPIGSTRLVNKSGRMKTTPTENIQNLSKDFVRSKVTLDKIEKPIRVEEFTLLDQLSMIKHQSKSQESLGATKQKFTSKINRKEYNPTTTIRNDSFGMKTIRQKSNKNDKSDLDFKIEEVKRNKELLETVKVKEK